MWLDRRRSSLFWISPWVLLWVSSILETPPSGVEGQTFSHSAYTPFTPTRTRQILKWVYWPPYLVFVVTVDSPRLLLFLEWAGGGVWGRVSIGGMGGTRHPSLLWCQWSLCWPRWIRDWTQRDNQVIRRQALYYSLHPCPTHYISLRYKDRGAMRLIASPRVNQEDENNQDTIVCNFHHPTF